jgi:hypothetical protein
VIFKITVTLRRKVGWVRFPHSPAIRLSLCILGLAVTSPMHLSAQQRDSARAGVPVQPTRATTPKPPMTPRRAFLTSLAIPGYAQTVFGRNKAAMLFTIVEIGSLGMARKSAIDLAEAKAFAGDSVVATYKIDPNTGLAILDPKTGQPVPETYVASRFTSDRVKARRTHYEDWIAAIVFNHLFAGADAYVAANLWDFRTNVGVASTSGSTVVYASIHFR